MKHTKVIFGFAFLVALLFSTTDQSQAEESKKITIKMQNTPVRTAIEKLSQLSNTDILYADAVLENYSISCNLTNVSIEEALADILKDYPIAFKRTKKNQLVLYSEHSQKTLDVSGYVVDARSGEALPYVNIQILNSHIGTSSNQYGQFALLDIPAEDATLKADYVGYRSSMHTLNKKNLAPHLKIEMEEYTISTETVIVEAYNWDVMDVGDHSSEISVSTDYFAQLPAVWSQDIMRSLQLMPGINQNSNGTTGLNIRGGSAAENLVTLDGMTLYQIDHVFGLLSVINPKMLKDIRVHKSGFEAKYGGRTAGFIEMTGKSGNVSAVHLETGASQLEFNGLLEIPLFGRGSLILSGRRSLFTEQAINFYEKLSNQPPFREDFPQIQNFDKDNIEYSSPRIMFYDTFAKMTLVPGNNDVINISGYLSHDEIREEFDSFSGSVNNRVKWGNKGFSLRWHRSWSEELYSNILISGSKYEINDALPADSTYYYSQGISNSDIDNYVEEYNIKMDNQWKLKWNHDVRAGFQLSRFETLFNEVIAEYDDILNHGAPGENIAFYLQDYWRVNSRISLSAGLRSTYYDRAEEYFWNPRLGAEFNIYDKWILKGSWGKYNQYILNFGNEFSNFEGRLTWMIADNGLLKPASSTHNVIGLKWENTSFLFDIELYRKNMTGLVEQLNSIEVENGVPNVKSSLIQRDGESTGLDLLLGKKRGQISGWISYSYNTTELLFKDQSMTYPAGSDLPHNLNIVGNYRYRSFSFSAVWGYSSGNRYTLPDTYTSDDLQGTIHFLTSPEKRFTERLPDRQRLDLSLFYNYSAAIFDTRFGLSLYNVLDHKNIWYRHFSMQSGRLSSEDVYMPGFAPTVVFELAFK